MSWTPQQEAAITARGASLVVSAAAGSGKTAVLVERLIRLLADTEQQTPAERLVVVTFTNDAAAEVRMRLHIALGQKLESEPENDWLRRQQTMLQSAHISTIHSFCFDLLREQFANAGISAGCRVVDEVEENLLRQETVSAVMEAFSKDAIHDTNIAKEQKMLIEAFCSGDDSNLEALILDLYRCVEEAPFGEEMLADAAKACQDGRMQKAAFEQINGKLEIVKMLQNRAMELLSAIGTDKQIAVLADEITLTDHLCGALGAGDTEQLANLLAGMKFATLTLPRKAEVAETAAMVKTLRNRAKDILKDLAELKVPLQFANEDLPRHAELLTALAKLVSAFDSELWERKQERSVIGFGDAMRRVLRLLAIRDENGKISKTPLAEQLAEQYACIMIDEFQDANNQQDLIFRMLSHGGDAEHYGDNLFVVGDSKQCIYRFRNANPKNFYRAMREGKPYVSPDLHENTCIHLNCNFRSAQEVVAFVNAVFSPLMTEQVGEIDYDDTQKLVQGKDFPDADRPVELLLLAGARASDAGEPAAVAERIAEHLKNGTPVSDNGILRPCRPKDFLILLRTSTQMPAYAKALADAGIPVSSIEQEGYLGSSEITLLLDILRAVDNPLLDTAVAAAMLSPMFGFSVDDLIAVRVCERKRHLFHGLQTLAADDDTSAELRTKCEQFLAFLESMRLFSAMETPEQLIRRIYQQTDFLGLMQMSENGNQKKSNLRALTTYARQFEENRGGGLSAFLRYLDAIISHKSDFKTNSAPAVSEDVVTLKTIHKSKGLEAPFVVLAHSDTGFSSKDKQKMFQFHAELGFGFKLHDPKNLTYGATLPYAAILERGQQEALSEELRLLYVALTRARERLILPIVYSKSYTEKADGYALEQMAFGGQTRALTASAGSMRDWLVMVLMRNPACEMLRRTFESERDVDDRLPALSIITSVREENTEQAEENNESAEETPAYDERLLAVIEQNCAWHYDSLQATLPAKYGVSEIAHGEDFSTPLRRPLFVREKHGLSGAERGTAMHTFMQYADFQAASENIHTEADRLLSLGRLTEKQAKAVKMSTLAKFFESELYQRITQAEHLSREEKFTVRLSDLQLDGNLRELGEQYAGTEGMLIGIMDLVFESAGKIVLVDYKTDRVSDASALLERYTEQLRLYAQALKLLRGKPVAECWLYSFTLQKGIPVSL